MPPRSQRNAPVPPPPAELSPPTPPASRQGAPTGAVCSATTRSGAPCAAAAGHNGFCSFHDPELTQVMADSRAAGGRARSKAAATVDADSPDLPVATASDIVALIADTISRVRKGTLDPRVANTIGYLSSVAIRGLEVGELERRLEHLESVVQSQSRGIERGAFAKRIAPNAPTSGEIA